MKIEYINGFKSLRFGKFLVQKRKEDFYGVYYINSGELLIHKKTWKQATKIASLLEFAYRQGYDETDEYYSNKYEDDFYYDDDY